jgi:phospholipase C
VPFLAYAIHHDDVQVRSYAVLPADRINDSWSIGDFDNGSYHLEVHGPNGFFRSFRGSKDDVAPDISCRYQTGTKSTKLTGNIEISLHNNDATAYTIEIADHYTGAAQTKQLDGHASLSVAINLSKNYGWYDVSVKIKGNNSFEKRYAGKVETGIESFTDPMMGRMI